MRVDNILRTMTQWTLLLTYLQITAVVALYWIVSILTVFVNKFLLSQGGKDAGTPFFVVWFQCLFSVGICILSKSLSGIFPNIWEFPKGSPFGYSTIRNVFPLSILFTCMIGFNLLCLKYVDVSFYYIGRSLTTVFNVIMTNFVLKERVSLNAIICCIVIVVGFILGVDQENVLGSLSVYGTLFGVLASFSLALYSIFTKKVLPKVGNHIWLLSYYNNVYSCIVLIPVMFLSGEVSHLWKIREELDLYYWSLMCVGGLCGFSIGYVTSLQIKVTSPLTHNISGTAKACAQTVIATVWYSEKKTILWWASNWIVLIGSAAYTRVKQLELQLKFESRPTRTI